MSRYKKKLFAILCLILLISPVRLPVSSQDLSKGIVISPSVYSIDLDKGNSYSYKVNINNASDEDIKSIAVSFETLHSMGKEGEPQIVPFEKDSQEQTWISTKNTIFDLPKQEQRSVDINLSVPLETKPGGYYFAIVFTKTAEKSDVNQVLITQRIVSLLFLNINGDTSKDIKFSNFSTDQYIYDPFFDFVSLKSEINLAGNSYYKPSGTIWAYQNSDIPFSSFKLNPKGKIILPDSTRTFENVSLPIFLVKLLSNQNNQFEQFVNTSDQDFKAPWFGNVKFQANARYINSDGQLDVVTSQTQVFFLPWKLGLLVISIAATLFLIFYYLRRKRRGKSSH